MQPILSISNLSKTYKSGFQALKNINLEIRKGEIFALLGPNGAGKTTLISIICGIVNPSEGHVIVDGYDIIRGLPRSTRSRIGLVPQELTTDAFETSGGDVHVSAAACSARQPNPAQSREGPEGALALGQEGQQDHDAFGRHEAPGADRQGAGARAARYSSSTSRPPASTSSSAATCGNWCASSRAGGVTIILTTHYIDEAEEMADRIGVINKGEIILVEDKAELMRKLGKKQLTLILQNRLDVHPGRRSLPTSSSFRRTEPSSPITYDTRASGPASRRSSRISARPGIRFKDLQTKQSSLEDIFVSLVRRAA